MSRRKTSILAGVLVLAVVVATILVARHRWLAPDPSCTSAGRAAQAGVQEVVEALPGTSNPSWRDGCKDGAVAALRFDYKGTARQFATAATAAGCTATRKTADAYACTAGGSRFLLTLKGADGSHTGLAVVTAP